MKVLLINAPSKYSAATTTDWHTTAEDIGAFPPIGLTYLAGYMLAHANHEVKILDSLGERITYQEVEERIVAYKPDLVGITAFTPTFYDILCVARLVKKHFPDCYVCLGGAHVSSYPNETMQHKEIDLLVHGEGEIIFVNLLNALEKGEDISVLDGVSCRKNGKIIHNTGRKGYIEDINALPSPAFGLLPLEKYKSAISTGNVCGTIASSRGCPYECTYCNRPYRSYRSYSNERILLEMRYFYNKGIKEFVFFDDMFNITPKRVIEISDAIIKEFPDIIWSFRGRVDQVTEDMVKKAKQAGCRQIMFGVEAANNEDLKAIKKRITTDQVLNAVRICKKFGVESSTNWIIGLPTHKSRQDVVDLLKFAIKTGSEYAQFNILIPYAETEIFNDGVKRSILKADFWNEYTLNPAPNACIPVWEEHLTREELSKLLKICYRKFYLRPSNIIRNAMKTKTVGQFKTKLKGLLIILGFGAFKKDKKNQTVEV